MLHVYGPGKVEILSKNLCYMWHHLTYLSDWGGCFVQLSLKKSEVLMLPEMTPKQVLEEPYIDASDQMNMALFTSQIDQI